MMKYERLTISSKNIVQQFENIKLENRNEFCLKCFDRLAELEDKIEQGLMVELPCKVGDTVYVIYQYSDFLGREDEPFIEEDIAQFFVYDENKMKIVPSRYGERSEYWYKALDILLTREEAEAKLKELQG